eukprot:7047796-Prymnesium_polylepis.1
MEQLLVGRVTERAFDPVEIPMRRVLGRSERSRKLPGPPLVSRHPPAANHSRRCGLSASIP